MPKALRLTSAASLAAIATMIAGCAAPHQSTGFGGVADGEIGLATRALAALNENDVPKAISFAERAVEKTPNDAGFRGLLGNAYFAAGRFWSAESAYKDALALYSEQPQVVLKLALVEVALGKNNEALAYLEAGRGVLDPADYGLALALAGRPQEAVGVLATAARAQGADARVRQNLALAYALSGDWTNARAIAAQDVPAAQLEARLQQWMKLATPTKASDQVASLVGITPILRDEGQPIRLALLKPDTRSAHASPPPAAAPAPAPAPVAVAQAAPPPAPVEVAEAAPVPAPVATPAPAPQFVEAVAPAQPVAESSVAPAPPPADPVRVAAKAAQATPAPVTMALLAAAAPEAPSAFAAVMPKPAPRAPKPVKARKVAAAAPRPVLHGTSGAVVQLGAYGSPQRVTEAWNTLTSRYPALNAYLPMRAKFVSAKGTFWRLSISGFANQREALSRCQLLKNRGGACFVRNFAGDAPVQYASR
jgi:Flp pilus assembly protein TadD